jgi:imidazoleglycerol-phosphate dehydratase
MSQHQKARKALIQRKTSETDIQLELNLDGTVDGSIQTGSGFLDHMLDLLQKHGGFGLSVICKGDSEIDMHHSTEDIAICFGDALAQCVQDKTGIERYGFYYVPMDEALARVALDLSDRIAFEFHADIKPTIIGNLETEMIPHFFKTVAHNAKINLHIDLIRGNNAHHCIEGIFKAFARALAMAVSPSSRVQGIPSTKGVL